MLVDIYNRITILREWENMAQENQLKIFVQESIKLKGIERGSNHTLTFDNISEVDNRIVSALSSSEQSLFKLSNASSAGTFITSSMKYARITNKDSSYPMRLRISSSLNNHAQMDFSIAAGASFLLSTSKISGSMTGNSNYQSFTDITDVLVQGSGSNVDVEYFIAST